MTNAACIVASVDGSKTHEAMKAMKAMKGHERYEADECMNATLLRSPMKAMNPALLRSPMKTMSHVAPNAACATQSLLRSPGEIAMSRSLKVNIQKGIRNQKACDEKDEYILGVINEVSNDDLEEAKRTSHECHKESENDMTASDDVTGSLLDPKRVRRNGIHKETRCVQKGAKE